MRPVLTLSDAVRLSYGTAFAALEMQLTLAARLWGISARIREEAQALAEPATVIDTVRSEPVAAPAAVAPPPVALPATPTAAVAAPPVALPAAPVDKAQLN